MKIGSGLCDTVVVIIPTANLSNNTDEDDDHAATQNLTQPHLGVTTKDADGASVPTDDLVVPQQKFEDVDDESHAEEGNITSKSEGCDPDTQVRFKMSDQQSKADII